MSPQTARKGVAFITATAVLLILIVLAHAGVTHP